MFDDVLDRLVIKQDAAASWFAGTYLVKVQSKSIDSEPTNTTSIDLTIYCPAKLVTSPDGEAQIKPLIANLASPTEFGQFTMEFSRAF